MSDCPEAANRARLIAEIARALDVPLPVLHGVSIPNEPPTTSVMVLAALFLNFEDETSRQRCLAFAAALARREKLRS